MAKFGVYTSPDGKRKLLKLGWSWGALIFGGVWLLFQRLWAIFITVAVVFGFLFMMAQFNPAASGAIRLVAIVLIVMVNLMIAVNGTGWVESRLIRSGWQRLGLVTARRRREAAKLAESNQFDPADHRSGMPG